MYLTIGVRGFADLKPLLSVEQKPHMPYSKTTASLFVSEAWWLGRALFEGISGFFVVVMGRHRIAT